MNGPFDADMPSKANCFNKTAYPQLSRIRLHYSIFPVRYSIFLPPTASHFPPKKTPRLLKILNLTVLN